MTSCFDANDRGSWYFGSMSRQDANDLLASERESGVFLVRDSNTIIGDFVLCVREDTKVSHYIINKLPPDYPNVPNGFRIGDQKFIDLPELINFYKLHYLDTTPLKRPAPRKLERVIGKFDFDGSDQDDLPFRRGEILTILSKDEDQWWTAKNAQGLIGQIPVPYVQKYDENGQKHNTIERPGSGGSGGGGAGNGGGGGGGGNGGIISGIIINNSRIGSSPHQLKSDLNRKLPALARVKQARVPNAYDKTALKLEIDDIIKVTKTNINGQWEGELKGKKGHFPFTHVEFIENIDNDICCQQLNDSQISPNTTNISITTSTSTSLPSTTTTTTTQSTTQSTTTTPPTTGNTLNNSSSNNSGIIVGNK